MFHFARNTNWKWRNYIYIYIRECRSAWIQLLFGFCGCAVWCTVTCVEMRLHDSLYVYSCPLNDDFIIVTSASTAMAAATAATSRVNFWALVCLAHWDGEFISHARRKWHTTCGIKVVKVCVCDTWAALRSALELRFCYYRCASMPFFALHRPHKSVEDSIYVNKRPSS